MMTEGQSSMGKFLSRNKVIMEDDMYEVDLDKYDQFLTERPWLKE